MVPTPETAEEQLLKMIEGPEAAQGRNSTQMAPVPEKGAASGLPAVTAWFTARLREFFRPGRGEWEGDPFLSHLRLASRILWVVLAGLGAYVVVDLLVIQPAFRNAHLSPSRGKEPSTQQEGAAVAVKSPLRALDDYLEAFSKRNPFTGGGLLGSSSLLGKTARQRMEELTKDLTLVGIDKGPKPAALVENAAQSRTVVVSEGDTISGMKVKKITSQGVVLSYEGEEFVLR